MIYFLIFSFGVAIGSFLNVLIYRLPRGEEFVKTKSHCPKCKTPLLWYDLIPLFSWLLLRGKCRYCNKKISWQYPLVELSNGLLYVLSFYYAAQFQFPISNFQFPNLLYFKLPVASYLLLVTIFYCFILSALLVIFVIDLKHYIIPDKVLAPLFVLTLVYRISPILYRIINNEAGIMHSGITGYQLLAACYSFLNPLLSSISAGGFFLGLVFITKGKGMGLGDVKFGAFMGLLLGFPAIVVALYTAFLTGALVSVILLLTGRKKFGQVVPFGPFLVLGTVAAMVYGEQLWKMFWNIY